jgi:NAD(P)-dependent dehydrogenase (short-subunit alcohol dehydrogenase family)
MKMTTDANLGSKTMVVTGATSGIGLAAARALSAKGASVIGVGRSAARCKQARDAILTHHPSAHITYLLADLSSQRQVRQLAAAIRDQATSSGAGQLDVLINNAATVSNWYTATEDGYELQFAVNHLAPFLLTLELLPLLKKASSARIITVSSGSHRNTRIHWQDVMLRRGYNTLRAYKQSKLANVLFTFELNRRLGEDSSVRAYAADPGLVNTEIGSKGTSGLVRWIWEKRRAGGVNPEQGAETLIYLAADASVDGSREVYWKDCRPVQASKYAHRAEEAARLWELSEHLCGTEAIQESREEESIKTP